MGVRSQLIAINLMYWFNISGKVVFTWQGHHGRWFWEKRNVCEWRWDPLMKQKPRVSSLQQNQTPNTHYLKAQSPKLELIMIQHCIVGYFHSVKEYPGVERKPSNRSALVGWSIKRGLFKLEPNYKEPFHNNLRYQKFWRKDVIFLF